MELPGDWIVPVILRCFSLYQQGSGSANDSLELEDDGSNLRFTNLIERLAVVDSCPNRSGVPTLNLTDDKTQIEAILSSNSLDAYHRDSPDRPLEKYKPQHYYVRLIAFEVVFEYSTSEPKLHLFVEQFSIDWGRGRVKSPRTGKKLNKHGNIESLMRMIFAKIKSQERPGTANSAGVSDKSFGSQDGRDSRKHSPENVLSETGISQQVFVSQMPSDSYVLASNNVPRVERGPPTGPTGLLGHLEPDVNLPGRVSLSNDANRQETNLPKPPSPTVTFEEKQSHDSHHTSKETDDHPMSISVRASPAASAMEGTPARIETGIPSAKVNEGVGPAELNIEPESAAKPPEESNQKSVEVEGPNSPPTEIIPKKPDTGISLIQSSPDKLDPWHGLTKIRSRDVKIPKDQNTLLEDNRCWFPPLPGSFMPQAHVPINLLPQWNKIALQKSRPVEEKEQRSRSPRAEASHSRGPSPNVTSPASQSGSQSTSERFSWSPSPSNRDPYLRQELPADSSPVSQRPRARKSESPRPRNTIRNGDRLLGSTEVGIHVSKEQNQRLTSEQPGEHRSLVEGQMQLDNELEPEKLDTSEPVLIDQTQQPEEESDGESNESDMDAAVPCPLGDSSQPALSTGQPEQEPTSSGPSLPRLDTHEHVQVVETPAADCRLCFERPGNENVGGFDEQSSQTAKSSSQSRVFNTYASNDSACKAGPSQEQHYSSQTNGDNGSNGVDVVGTQISSGNWTIHGTTPNSHSGFVPNSSGPNAREPSVPLPTSGTQGEGTPQQFSSYRDVPMFPSDEGSFGSSSQSSKQELRHTLESIRPPNLKRLASVMETDQRSPSKRYKSERYGDQDTHRNKSKGPTSNIMSRRQSYIGSTAKRAEAVQAYEKFRTDYPIYTGDFAHFIKLCSMLQNLRDKGHMKRSFLWDDFIIMHLEQYPSYLQLCLGMEAETMEYEEYFGAHFIKPTYKKRSLTVTGVEVSAAQHIATTQSGTSASPFVARGDANVSFTPSLVDKLSNFHAHSFGPEPKSNLSDNEGDISGFASSPTPLRKPGRDISIPTQHFTVDEPTFGRQLSRESSYNPPIDKPTTAEIVEPGSDGPAADEPAAREPVVNKSIVDQPFNYEAVDYDSTVDEPAANRQLQMEYAHALIAEEPSSNEAMAEDSTIDEHAADEHLEMETTSQSSHFVSTNHENEAAPSIPESEQGGDDNNDDEKEEYDEMEATHETASIELGDDEPSIAPQEFLSDAQEPEASSEAESVNENWFDSLRHLRPPVGPVWSDDPNTPFKMWARADQNVKTEVRRRGNRYRDVDQNGVIQRSTHPAHPK